MRRFKVFVIFLFIGNESFPTIQMDVKSPSKQLRDVTNPLDALMQGQISSMDFFTKSGYVENGTETKTKLNLYSLYSSTIQDFFGEINAVGRYWNDTLGRDLSDLTMSITLNNNTLAKLANYNKRSVKLKAPNFRTNYLLNIDKTMTCDDLSNRRPGVWNLLNLLELTERDWGIGINEALLNCQAAADQIYERKWAVVYFKFGDTVGIPESFGIFRKRMAYMHAETAKVLRRYTRYHEPTLPEIWYYPTVEAVGDENHYRLFENYMERWQDDGIEGMQLIFRTKLFSSTQNGFDEASKSLVLSYITYTKDSWNAPSIVREFSKHFKIIILEYDGWKLWKLNSMEAPYNSDDDNLPPLDKKIEVIIDYSFAIEDGIVNANGELIQDGLEVLQHINSMEPFVLKSILFDIKLQEDIESVSIQELSQSATFLKFLNEIPSKGKCAVQGVHIDLSTYGVQVIINDTRIAKTLVEKGQELGIKIVYAGREMWRPLPLGTRPKIPMKEEGSETSLTVIVVRGLGAILIIGLIAVSSFLYIRYKKVSQFLSDEEVMEFLNGRSLPIDGSGQQPANNCASIEYMKFRKDYDLQLPDCVIGKL
ncbi:unnamed protein product [Orchesella dallaii]|uniref:Uncharacterized protein n=1 Tax=Orchesella dallaii TaxID=48710 RepID=A0ABP1RPF4_9HEXA